MRALTHIDTEVFSSHLREKLLLSAERKVLLARLNGSDQEKDSYTHVNCRGYGRIRHFRFYTLHLENASKGNTSPRPLLRGHAPSEIIRSQVFQLSGCNWRCWYCFVDDDRLAADHRVSDYFTADEMIKMYMEEEDRPDIIDLSGGQPDLVPEWGLWVMEAMESYGLRDKVFLWSDDNLSNRYIWQFLTRQQIAYMASFPKYSRMGCFKGYDEASFSFNTHAAPELFNQQFGIFRDLMNEGFDMYAYATFTAPPVENVSKSVARFVDKLQEIHQNLPLRTIPLKIKAFTTTQSRMKYDHERAIAFQYEVYDAWVAELNRRFTLEERNMAFSDVTLNSVVK